MRQPTKKLKKTKAPFFSMETALNGVQKLLDKRQKSQRHMRGPRRPKKASTYRKGYIYLLGLIFMGASTYGAFVFDMHEKLAKYTCNQFIKLTAAIGLKIDDVYVEGRQHASQYQVLDAVQARRGEPILAYDIEHIRSQLERIDWVRTAIVQRRLPNILFVQLIERKPIAMWHHQDTLYLVDQEGVAITPTSMETFRGLPLVIGMDAPLHAPKILSVIEKFPEISKRLTSVTRIRERRWDLTIDQKTLVKLPEDNMEEALGTLSLLLEKRKITGDDVSVVDIRVPSQVIIRLGRLAAVGLKMKGNDT
jgi:cell division protein FtsQ